MPKVPLFTFIRLQCGSVVTLNQQQKRQTAPNGQTQPVLPDHKGIGMQRLPSPDQEIPQIVFVISVDKKRHTHIIYVPDRESLAVVCLHLQHRTQCHNSPSTADASRLL